MYKINHANIKDWAANYDGELFDGILCDPPYEPDFYPCDENMSVRLTK